MRKLILECKFSQGESWLFQTDPFKEGENGSGPNVHKTECAAMCSGHPGHISNAI